MSVRVMSAVWQNAPFSGGTLLVLLALADWCDDDGYCWPSVPAIAAKARLTERQVQNILGRFRVQGIVTVEQGGGRGIANRYLVHPQTLKPTSPIVPAETVKPISPKSAERVKSATEKGEICSSAIRKNRQDPSSCARRRKKPKQAHQTDPRFTPTQKRLAQAFYQVAKSDEPPPWDGHCARELTEWLKNHNLSQAAVDALITNVEASENAEQWLRDPARLIPRLRKYTAPLDRYNNRIPGAVAATASKPQFDLGDPSPSKANPESVRLMEKWAQQEGQEAAVAAAGAKC